MNTCKTCKHWAKPDSTLPKVMAGGACVSGKIVEDWDGEYKSDTLVYPYTEGGYFWTGPDFGCVHHTPKEPSVTLKSNEAMKAFEAVVATMPDDAVVLTYDGRNGQKVEVTAKEWRAGSWLEPGTSFTAYPWQFKADST